MTHSSPFDNFPRRQHANGAITKEKDSIPLFRREARKRIHHTLSRVKANYLKTQVIELKHNTVLSRLFCLPTNCMFSLNLHDLRYKLIEFISWRLFLLLRFLNSVATCSGRRDWNRNKIPISSTRKIKKRLCERVFQKQKNMK